MQLLERETEVGRLSAAIAGARDRSRGAVVLVEGAAGLGKTALLRHAQSLASGLTVLSASGSELEHDFGFGVVRQLLERGSNVEGALATGGDRFAALHALYWLVAELAEERPLLVCVDDAQWADDPSLRFLAFLARRVPGLPVALVIAARPQLPGDDRTILEAIAAEASTLLPAPLTEAAIAALVGAGADPAFVSAVQAATAGNALLVGEVLAEAREGSMHTTCIPGSSPGIPTGSKMHTSRIPVPGVGIPGVSQVYASGERIGRRVARQFAALGDAAAPLAAAVAVLGDGAELATAARLAGVGEEDARAAAAELVAADVFDDDRLLRFRHPLIRAAVAERLPAVERAQAHARAARLLAERGRPPGMIAAHLLAAPAAGDPWATKTLVAAARELRAQGAPELAATYLRRALAESPAPDVALLLELGRAEHAAGDPAAPDRLHEAWSATHDGEVALELGAMLNEQTRWVDGAAIGREALERVQERELDLRLRALVADCVRMDPAIGGDEPETLRALAATLGGDTPAERMVLATAAVITPVDTADEHARAAMLAQRTWADGARVTETGVVSNLIRAARLDDAERIIEDVLEAARRGGFIRRHAAMLSMRGWIALERGELAAARDDLEAALELGPQVALPPVVIASAGGMLALVVAELGELERAEELLAAHDLAGELPAHQVMNLLLHFRSRVRLAQGRSEDALADALDVGRRYARLGLKRAVPPWRSIAAILSGDRALADEELALADRWGTPLARAQALRGVGLVAHDTAALQAAVDLLEPSPHRLELARARVDLGAALRRAGRRAQAREPLRLGMDGAYACGARPLADRARTELLATGARPRRLALQGADALTPSEARIAALAAQGRTNRQIAQALFVTSATVETHLRHVFRKLDVKSRGELGTALSP